MPEVSTVDVDSDEFQEVVKDFYDTLKDNHNKIKIIKVRFNIQRLNCKKKKKNLAGGLVDEGLTLITTG